MKTYLESTRAYTLFRNSAWWTSILAGYLLVLIPMYGRIASNDIALTVTRVVGACLGVVGALAGLTIFFGMLLHLLRCDRSSAMRKILWITVFFFTAWFGSSLYFFVVYRRHVPRELKESV
jgi:hypothetical protein